MKKIIGYLLVYLAISIFLSVIHLLKEMPQWYLSILLFVQCAVIGAVGGILYNIRAIYLNKCVRKSWDEEWEIWYYLRPIASTICGFVSCIFLKAGLLILEAEQVTDTTSFGYYALAFIAGYNVDNFLKKLESIAKSVWGIDKSRSSGDDDENNDSKENK